jgi:hypothetical protein
VDEAARGVAGRGRAEVCDLLKVRADYSDGEVGYSDGGCRQGFRSR